MTEQKTSKNPVPRLCSGTSLPLVRASPGTGNFSSLWMITRDTQSENNHSGSFQLTDQHVLEVRHSCTGCSRMDRTGRSPSSYGPVGRVLLGKTDH